MDLNSFSLKIANYKCFGEEPQGFEAIKPINILIGRNNSGKSSLLDLIEKCCASKTPEIPEMQLWHHGKKPLVIAQAPLSEASVKRQFQENYSGGDIGVNHWEYGKQYIGARFRWSPSDPGLIEHIQIADIQTQYRPITELRSAKEYLTGLAAAQSTPFKGKEFSKISAERDIQRDGNDSNLDLTPNGDGATNIIQVYLNNRNKEPKLVENTLLDALNYIFNPDSNFSRIGCKRLGDGLWEIYLEEDAKGRIDLSQSGSGLKTVILVLIHIILKPHEDNKQLSDYVFAFEELENNLHPALLRRLLLYIREQSQKGPLFFLTTHSSAVIDMFSRDEDAQIVHVTHDSNSAKCCTATTYIHNRDILDDLDVRASDILQSNGVIWVEGPSDRAYLGRWIYLWSNEELEEGIHYQCIFYGGRLLAHLSADSPDSGDNGISLLRANRNGIVVIDSDKKTPKAHVNKTKCRLRDEISAMGGHAWITSGKEIENYIPAGVIQKWLKTGKALRQVDQFENFFEYLEDFKTGLGKYKDKKVQLAEELSSCTDKEDLRGVMDLAKQLDTVCAAIRRWNSTAPSFDGPACES